MRRTVRLAAELNTELIGALIEMKRMRRQAREDRLRIAQLEAQINGHQEPPPQWPAMSPPHDDPDYGDDAGRTRIE